MTIKMKDMLLLPVKREAGGVMPFLKDAAGEVMFVGSRYHVDLCVTAINAYDANQELIECLKNQVSQLKSENESMAAYAEQRINMLTRVNNKLREGKS